MGSRVGDRGARTVCTTECVYCVLCVPCVLCVLCAPQSVCTVCCALCVPCMLCVPCVLCVRVPYVLCAVCAVCTHTHRLGAVGTYSVYSDREVLLVAVMAGGTQCHGVLWVNWEFTEAEGQWPPRQRVVRSKNWSGTVGEAPGSGPWLAPLAADRPGE